MGKVDFVAYQREFESGDWRLLYELIMVISKQIVPHYPPNQYQPFYSKWDENAVREVAHEFIISWLLAGGRLEYHLFSQIDADSFERIMRGELRRFMINNRRKSELNNLFKRMKVLLREEEAFKSFGQIDRNNELWGLAEWDNLPIVTSQDEVLEVMWSIDIPPLIKYRPDSKKISHLLTTKTLKYILAQTFGSLHKKVGLFMLMQALVYRLGLTEITEQSFYDVISHVEDITLADVIPAPDTPIDEQLVADEVADDVYNMLTDRQREVLAQYLISTNGTLNEISESLNISKSTIHNELQAIERLISARVSEDESENVFAKLSELCMEYAADDDTQSKGTVAKTEEKQ